MDDDIIPVQGTNTPIAFQIFTIYLDIQFLYRQHFNQNEVHYNEPVSIGDVPIKNMLVQFPVTPREICTEMKRTKMKYIL